MALFGDKLLDVSLLKKSFHDCMPTSAKMQCMSVGEYTIRRNSILSNSNMQNCGSHFLVPHILSPKEWSSIKSAKCAGTAFEAAVGCLYHIEGGETPSYHNMMNKILDLLVTSAETHNVEFKHPKSTLIELGGRVEVKESGFERFTAIAYLGDNIGKCDRRYTSKKDAELAAVADVLKFTEHKDASNVSGCSSSCSPSTRQTCQHTQQSEPGNWNSDNMIGPTEHCLLQVAGFPLNSNQNLVFNHSMMPLQTNSVTRFEPLVTGQHRRNYAREKTQKILKKMRKKNTVKGAHPVVCRQGTQTERIKGRAKRKKNH
eukprot:CAMPEP_0196572634 /NCGR_PEP_ID=MMETSP1081-20130531/2640_1 /TAXON_ID=36882 /ORGANISM="Pyramimonas amylifera, Strain CCMP720" /LENGTH=314 /DNA_ID=CAMNT_0041890009 /DNA_START=600 /DNA_END=1544 /DNA_ORIENTATION=-